MSGTHLPKRPSWKCGSCDDDWPCEPRRRLLLAQFDESRVLLCCVLAEYFVDACCDLPSGATGDLYRRFFDWARDDRPPAAYVRAARRSAGPPRAT